jgi:hypothetical protein
MGRFATRFLIFLIFRSRMDTPTLIRLKRLMSVRHLATLSGIPVQTLHTKLRRGTDLSPEESESIDNVLHAWGIYPKRVGESREGFIARLALTIPQETPRREAEAVEETL